MSVDIKSNGMVKKYEPPSGQNLMCITYHDKELPMYQSHELKIRLKNTFHYSLTFTEVSHFASYLGQEDTFIVQKLVIIISGREVKNLCGTIKTDEYFLQYPLVYELQFDNKSLQSDLSNDRKFQSIDNLFEKISNDVKLHFKVNTKLINSLSVTFK